MADGERIERHLGLHATASSATAAARLGIGVDTVVPVIPRRLDLSHPYNSADLSRDEADAMRLDRLRTLAISLLERDDKTYTTVPVDQ